jgi:general nucleoside transport system ATP-binding protein
MGISSEPEFSYPSGAESPAVDLAGSKAPALRALGVTKAFPGVLANDSVTFEVRAGEIHGLLGENGAGKTTLCKILTGLYQPDAGVVYVDGQPKILRSPSDALMAGIFMVQQHFSLVERFTVLENMVLGLKHASLRGRARNSLIAEIKSASDEYNLQVDLSAYTWQLSMGERQRVEILKALYRGARILILDEPTTTLTPSESKQLEASLRSLASQKTAVVFVSHKLPEVLAVCDRLTILRKGRSIAAVDLHASAMTSRRLAEMMVGREISLESRRLHEKGWSSPDVLVLDAVTTTNEYRRAVVNRVSLTLKAGEILGVAGVAGNGQRALADTIAGLRPHTAGTITVAGQQLRNGNPADAIRAGAAYVPEDRFGTALVPSLPISDNLILKTAWSPPCSRFSLINSKAVASITRQLIRDFGIIGHPHTLAGQLSGGNAQKVVLARELSGKPKVIIAASPTGGLDVSAAATVRQILIDAATSGAGILLFSEDLDEILDLCDRIAVMYRGSIVGIQYRTTADRSTIGMMMMGVAPHDSLGAPTAT